MGKRGKKVQLATSEIDKTSSSSKCVAVTFEEVDVGINLTRSSDKTRKPAKFERFDLSDFNQVDAYGNRQQVFVPSESPPQRPGIKRAQEQEKAKAKPPSCQKYTPVIEQLDLTGYTPNAYGDLQKLTGVFMRPVRQSGTKRTREEVQEENVATTSASRLNP